MNRPKALLAIAVLFLVGVVVGVAATHLYYIHRFSQPGSIAEAAVDFGAHHLAETLDLRPDQRRELDHILAEATVEVEGVRKDAVLELRDLRDRSALRLEALLDEEQKQKLKALHAEQGRLFDKYLE